MHVPSLLAGTPLFRKRTTAESGEKEKKGLGNITSMSHQGIDVTSLSFGLIHPKKLHLKDKRDIRENSLNMKWERSDREK